MSDYLEKFVRDNRDSFEQEGPSADLWSHIADQLPDDAAKPDVSVGPLASGTSPTGQVRQPFQAVRRRASWTQSRWTWAASIALLLLAGGLWYVNDRYAVTDQPDVVAISPGYAREVAQYASLIDLKRTELQQLTMSNPALYGEFKQDLNDLETSYRGLKKDLPDTPNQDMLIQAMIQNLQLQIDLLNEQLRVIQRIRQQTSTTHAPV